MALIIKNGKVVEKHLSTANIKDIQKKLNENKNNNVLRNVLLEASKVKINRRIAV